MLFALYVCSFHTMSWNHISRRQIYEEIKMSGEAIELTICAQLAAYLYGVVTFRNEFSSLSFQSVNRPCATNVFTTDKLKVDT